MRRTDRAIAAMIDAGEGQRGGAGEDSVTTALSPAMTEALRRCRESGGLKYVRGGLWIEATQDPAPFLRASQSPQMARSSTLPWHCSTHTVKALVKRGVVRETEFKDGYPARVEAT